ncbi:CDR ABC transporter [Penicillium expansum]|nr:CDR ABC transporter [Penicillium expansum]
MVPNSPPEIPVKWGLSGEVSAMQERDLAAGYSKRELGVTWKNLTVDVLSAGASVNENFFSQFNLLQLARDLRQKPAVRSILQDSHGCVKPGEMLLVLGRPGSGCTTLLNVLSNRRAGYRSVSGDVKFGSMTPEEAEQYKGQIVMNSEEEVFFPTLTVGQTMDFATRLKIPFHIPDGVTPADWAGDFKRFLMESMKISHTEETKVGNEFVRGVSGGERKRVSIIECMATRGSVFCWDNSTRGLDASTALEWAKALRAMTDILGLTTIVTLYQAGNGIYDLFDKVLVLDEGQQIFYGPAPLAKPFMEGLGFGYTDGANVSDYLTGITVPTERSILPGYEGSFPQNPDELLGIYQKSDICQNAMLEYDYASTPLAQERTSAFQDSVAFEKNTSLPKGSPLTTAFHHQLKICIIRQYQIIWGEKSTFLIRQFVSLAMALIVGSCFYDSPDTSAGLFTKGGAVFFSHVYQVTMAMAEGRPILIKHKSFGYHHPAAYAIAILTAELPVVLFQCTIFSVVLYWMVGLKATAAAFFTFWIILIAITLCVNAMFRSIGAACSNLEVASKVSGIVMKFLVMYTGYMIPKPQIKNWFVELYYANPMAYAFQAGLTNEFHDKTLPCVGGSLIPHGAGYNDSNYQSCAGVAGAEKGATYVTGDNYLAALHWKHSQLWRNFGVVWGWWTFFVAIAVVSTCMWRAGGAGSNSLLIPREKMKHFQRPRDEETQSPGNKESQSNNPITADDSQNETRLMRNTSFATSLWTQTKLVTARMSVSLARNTKYVNNKLELHIISALLNGFSFWHLGPSVSALQLKMFTIFNFTFVAPGVINQLQPLFIQRRDIYDAREKKSRMYSWKAFVTGLIVSEFPYLCLCAVSYFVCWYYQTNLPRDSKNVGATFFIMLIYEFIYTGIGQFVAAYAPNATFAALVNPLIVNSLVLFCGAFVPQPQLNVFWKFWFYYLNPFNYVVAGMFTFGIWDATVTCNAEEFAYFDPPNGTCKDYLADYMAGVGSAINLINPEATSQCQVCQYTRGSDYLKNLNINHYYYGWRDAGICVIFAISGYALVFGLMKLRTKASKKAE